MPMDFLRKLFPAPQTPDELVKLGNEELEKGNFETAIEHYNAAVRLDPRFAHAYYARGVVAAKKGDFRNALADFEQAFRLKPLALYLRVVAAARFNLGHYQRAVADLNNIIPVTPLDASLFYD